MPTTAPRKKKTTRPDIPANARRQARTVTLGDNGQKSTDNSANPFDGWELLVDIPLEKLHNHPANPDPSEAEIQQMVEWLRADGRQEEPIVVRPHVGADLDGVSHYQILGGKRRYLAAQRLGWPTLRAVIRHDLAKDTQGALLTIVRSNAHRHEDTPIRQAELLQTLLRAGLSREQAGREFGLQTAAAVTAKIGLLKLPEVWQQRIISGEMSQSAAIGIVPYADCPTIMAAFEDVWKSEINRDDFLHKDRQRSVILDVVAELTRPIKPDSSQPYNGATYYRAPECSRPNWYQRCFDLTPELEQSLQIVELPIGKNGAKIPRALNVQEYDRLNLAAINAQQTKQAKKTAAKTDRQDRAKTLYRKRCEWCGDWLRGILAFSVDEAIRGGCDWLPALRLYDWWAIQRPDHAGFLSEPLDRPMVGRHAMWQDAAKEVDPSLCVSSGWLQLETNWDILHALDENQLTDVRLNLVKRLLLAANRDSRYPVIPLFILIQTAESWAIDWRTEWPSRHHEGGPALLESWLSFHRGPELLDLAATDWQNGIDLEPNWTAKRMRDAILAAAMQSDLPMPACLDEIRKDHLPENKGK
jgi:ParB/RepB/Spo0J family partition protein